MIKLKDLLKLLQTGAFRVHIRRAFGDCDTYYDGLAHDIPEEFRYFNHGVEAIYPFNYVKGDVCWESCEALDIAINDLILE